MKLDNVYDIQTLRPIRKKDLDDYERYNLRDLMSQLDLFTMVGKFPPGFDEDIFWQRVLRACNYKSPFNDQDK